MLGEVRPLMGLLFPVLVVNSCSPDSEYLSISVYLAGWPRVSCGRALYAIYAFG